MYVKYFCLNQGGWARGGGGGGAGVITYCEIPLKIEFIVVSSRSCNFGEEQHFCMVSKAADRYHSPLIYQQQLYYLLYGINYPYQN